MSESRLLIKTGNVLIKCMSNIHDDSNTASETYENYVGKVVCSHIIPEYA